MAVAQIHTMGHPILNRVADPVPDPRDPAVARIAQDMQDTLDDIGAAAIAAPQIGQPIRLVVYRLSPRFIADPAAITSNDWIVMVNPILTPQSERMVAGWERCLSIPGLHGKVPRHADLHLAYETLQGEPIEQTVEGVVAAMMQHECDHLDGVLYPMRMTDLSCLEFDASPGHLAEDVEAGAVVWPVLRQLAEAWDRRDDR